MPADRTDDPVDPSARDELPASTVERVERLTRRARATVDDAEAEAYRSRRDELLTEHAYSVRIRTDENGDTLVCYPEEWHEGDTVQPKRINDTSRAVEIALDGPEDPGDWAAVDRENRNLVDAVREAHGDVHGENAATLADFAGNHYAKPIPSLTGSELAEFRTEYFERNAWPTDEQRRDLDASIETVYDVAGEPVPDWQPQ